MWMIFKEGTYYNRDWGLSIYSYFITEIISYQDSALRVSLETIFEYTIHN